jgi:hypothetical protein
VFGDDKVLIVFRREGEMRGNLTAGFEEWVCDGGLGRAVGPRFDLSVSEFSNGNRGDAKGVVGRHRHNVSVRYLDSTESLLLGFAVTGVRQLSLFD